MASPCVELTCFSTTVTRKVRRNCDAKFKHQKFSVRMHSSGTACECWDVVLV